ncbi:MAG: hypothetical protein F6K54_10365 [Okeania sp. SIO3B5]|uniref:hypothetical protein n=1 Tax=Okeania sp. SIO3B5 TaxID=2607811 RepID=UPI001400054E|nr:hypothetical protein [Okeania sp. SIO3B5]NEO53449.1 hypothetical protein [Okeania sp. SIO3B5]
MHINSRALSLFLLREQWKLLAPMTEELRFEASPLKDKQEKNFLLVNPIRFQGEVIINY